MRQMLDFRERSQIRRALYSKPTILVFATLALLAAHGAWGMYQKSVEAQAKRDRAAAELAALQVRERELSGDIERLSTPRGQEGEIRDRFMVAKEGEKVIIVSDPEREVTHTVTVPEDASPSILDKLKAAVGVSGQ